MHHHTTTSFVASVHSTEQEAIDYCNKYYDVVDKDKLWKFYGYDIFIDEVEFNGLVNDQALP